MQARSIGERTVIFAPLPPASPKVRMAPMRLRTIVLGVLAFSLFRLEARVVRFVIEDRQPFAGSAQWGSAGAYEKVTGTAYIELDPRDPLNALIVDLDQAPRTSDGAVPFSTPFFILKPSDPARWNHKIYYTANNRGNDPLLTVKTADQVGSNDLALRLGYAIVDAGWEGDVVGSATRLAVRVPIATQADGSPIVGLMRVEYSARNIPAGGAFTLNLEGSSGFTSYPAADVNPQRSTLTVRDAVSGAKTPIPPDKWAFGKCPTGRASLQPSATDICYFDKFQPNKIFELIYPAKDPKVMGLGFAATRDVASFLRYEKQDTQGNANPLSGDVRRIYATGASQTGGYLRDLLYLGFNEDESHRKVFDGVIPTIAGTDRVFINVRFADPNIWSDQDDRHDYLQTSYPPFTYGITTDLVTGIRDGVLKRPATDPYIFQIDSAAEFWQLRASLNTVDGEGREVPIPKNVRLYFVSSTSHGFTAGGLLTRPAANNPQCQYPAPAATAETTRALLVAMDAWVDRGIEPPPSNYPKISDGTLVPIEQARKVFPVIPGVNFPMAANELPILDFGPAFGRLGGIRTLEPPLVRHIDPVLVPKADADGLDIAGVRSMQIRAPLGTSLGWNLRVPGQGGPNLCGLTGSYLAFAKTKAERTAKGDSRSSLEERYGTHDGFVGAVRKAAKELVDARFLLPEDAERFIQAAISSDLLQ